MSKIGRNDLCMCGSGKKYKKCCMKKNEAEYSLQDQEIIKHFQQIQERQSFLKKAGFHKSYVKPIMFKGKKVFALGNKVYPDCPPNTTFHTFLIEMLKETLGYDWLHYQASLPNKERHFISICLEKLGEWINKNEKVAERVSESVWGAKPDGYSKSLLLLAFDVCSLIHTNKLPSSLIDRLKSRDHYQGARYEIAIAAIFARLDCDIEFTDENSKNKHCEFVVTHRETGAVLAVEAKSKKRKGILHETGFLPSLEKLLSARVIRRMFKEALEQNPKDVPFATFIDINAPLTPEVELNNKQWVRDVKILFKKRLKLSSLEEYPLNAAFFTNFSYHYQTEDEAEQGESIGIVVPHPKFPPPNKNFFMYLQGALTHYGIVPAIDLDDSLELKDVSRPPN